MTTITIRASSLPAYQGCQLRAAAHAMPRLFAEHGHELAPQRGNVGALVGTGLHGAGEVGLKEKMSSGSIAPLSVLEDAAVEAFRARYAEERDNTVEIVMDQQTPTIREAELQLQRMARSYRDGVLFQAEPLVVESRITARFDDHVTLSGQSDLLHLDDQAGVPCVRDLKTGRTKRPAATHGPQLGAYSLLFRSRGLEPGLCQIDFIKRESPSKPQSPVEPERVSIESAEQQAHSILRDWSIKAVAFAADGQTDRFIVNPSNMLCNPKFCRLHGKPACPATRNV